MTFPERARRWWPAAAAAALVVAYVVVNASLPDAAFSDEDIYFYMSVRTGFAGRLPYRDYFFAHPPLHLFISIAIFKAASLAYAIAHASLDAGREIFLGAAGWTEGGYALRIARWIPRLAGAASGVLVHRIARRIGPLEAVLAMAAFLFSYNTLAFTFTFTGAAEAGFFALLGAERALAGRDRQAGIAFAAAALTAMYAAPIGVASLLVVYRADRRRALRLALWTAAPIVAVHAIFLAAFGDDYFYQVFRYHLQKPAGPGEFAHAFWRLARQNGHLCAAPLPALAAVWLLRRAVAADAGPKKRKPPRAAPLPAAMRDVFALGLGGYAASLVFIASQSQPFLFYFHVTFICAALLVGIGWAAAARAGFATARAIVRGGDPRAAAVPFLALFACVAAGEVVPKLPPAASRTSPREAKSGLAVVRFLRDAGGGFDFPSQAAAWIRANTRPDARVFGDSNAAPLVALMAGRLLAFDEADTNPMRYASGRETEASLVDRLRREPPDVIVFWESDPLLATVEEAHFLGGYELVRKFAASNGRGYYLFRRKPGRRG